MPTTFDKILGKPLLHTHAASDITGLIGGDSDVVQMIDATVDNVTVSLPSLAGVQGKKYIIKKIDASTHTVIITPDGTDKIENLSESLIIEFQNSAVCLMATATGWFII